MDVELTRASNPAGFTVAAYRTPPAPGEELCPRDFWLTRVAASVLKKRWVTVALVLSALVPGVIGTVWPCSAWVLCTPSPLSYIHWGLNAFYLTTLTGVLPSLRSVTSAGGELEQLGAGTGMIATPPANGSLGLHGLWINISFWARLLSVLAAAVSASYIFMTAWWIAEDKNVASIVHDFVQGPLYFVTIPLAVAWYLTLKMGSALVAHAVI